MQGIGSVLAGRFELQTLLGEGGMGQVFLALDRELDRHVAIKMLLPQLRHDRRGLDDLRREVQVSARLSHPGIVSVFDLRSDGDTPFIIMEYVRGVPLSHFIYGQPDHRIQDMSVFRRMALEILTAVAHAHGRGVVHRDLKSSNFMVTPNGHVKVMDFGIAATLLDAHTRLTGQSSGLTVQYSSPEQINGEPPTPTMDVYSLGCVFYEMLSGYPPFHQGDVLYQQLTKTPSPLNGVPVAIERLVQLALKKNPRDRPADAAAYLELFKGGGRPSRRLTVPVPLADKDPATIGRFLVGGGLAIGLVAAGLFWLTSTGPPRAPALGPSGREIPGAETLSPPPPMEDRSTSGSTLADSDGPVAPGTGGEAGPSGGGPGEALPPPEETRVTVVPPDVRPPAVSDQQPVADTPRRPVEEPRPPPPPPAPGILDISISGGVWAYFTVDGGERYETPRRLTLPAGRYVVRVFRPGFQDIVDNVEVRPSAEVSRRYELRSGG